LDTYGLLAEFGKFLEHVLYGFVEDAKAFRKEFYSFKAKMFLHISVINWVRFEMSDGYYIHYILYYYDQPGGAVN
jgi:hypothetical protein